MTWKVIDSSVMARRLLTARLWVEKWLYRSLGLTNNLRLTEFDCRHIVWSTGLEFRRFSKRFSMERPMDFLISWLFALALVTVIGHGIWVLIAAIFRALFVESKAPSDGAEAKRAAQCVVCGAVSSADDIFCHFCGQPRTSAGPIAELALAARLLDKFLAKGRLDAETHKLVMDVIEEERARLTTPVRP